MTQKAISADLNCSLERVRGAMRELTKEKAKAAVREELRAMKLSELKEFVTQTNGKLSEDTQQSAGVPKQYYK